MQVVVMRNAQVTVAHQHVTTIPGTVLEPVQMDSLVNTVKYLALSNNSLQQAY